jgi:hypothetical protein
MFDLNQQVWKFFFEFLGFDRSLYHHHAILTGMRKRFNKIFKT